MVTRPAARHNIRLEQIAADESNRFDLVVCKCLDFQKKKMDILSYDGQIKKISENKYWFCNDKQTIAFSILDASIKKSIDTRIYQNFFNLTQINRAGGKIIKDEAGYPLLDFNIVFFPRHMYWGTLPIIIGNAVRKSLEKHDVWDAKAQDPFVACVNNFQLTYKNGEDNYFIYKKMSKDYPEIEKDLDEDTEPTQEKAVQTEEFDAGTPSPAIDNDNEDLLSKQDEIYTVPRRSEKLLGKFKLVGKEYNLLFRIEGEGAEVRAVADRAEFQKHKSTQNRYEDIFPNCLGTGKLVFCSENKFVSAYVKKILQETPNYLKSWEAYAKQEGEVLLSKARSIGYMSYSNPTIHGDKLNIDITQVTPLDGLKYLEVGDTLAVHKDIPDYLNSDGSWELYKATVMSNNTKKTDDENQSMSEGTEIKKSRADNYVKVEAIHDNHLLLSFPNGGSLPDGKKLVFSMYGDEKQILRREEARRRIEAGSSANPNLGLILGADANDVISMRLEENRKTHRHIEPVSPAVLNKIFAHPPTINQKKAIDIALNTPDIAVIQGPPGTGKTTVITAILERLNEIADKKEVRPGQVLVTSLQHDAVDNIIDRIKINSLPTVKFGAKRNDKAEDINTAVQKWCYEMAAKLEEKNPALKDSAEIQRLFEVFTAYNLNPSDEMATKFLQFAKTLCVDEDLRRRIDELLDEIAPVKKAMTTNLQKEIYRLRITEEGFSDDGASQAMALYDTLDDLFGEEPTAKQKQQLKVLRKAAGTTGIPTAELMAEIKKLRNELLKICKPRPVYEENEVNGEVVDIYNDLKELLRKPGAVLDEAIYNLYRELQDCSERLVNSLSDYTFAFAATAQHSERIEIKKKKGIKNPWQLEAHAEYDTVIVDEAARVAPGDLMIPLSQASRRIILVGDQRQLPHMYSSEIFQTLKEEGKLHNEQDIEISMFQHLWNRAKELEKKDHIKRTVTLDYQYRTHPELGNFVSEMFYAPYGESFKSTLPAANFTQNISPLPYRWVNIPASKGGTEKIGASKCRKAEADYIVNTLKEYLNDEQYADLNFGVISFYRGQADLIEKILGSAYNKKRVRIGTVDQFQGMEFDVIFLSTVRSGIDFSSVDFSRLEDEKDARYISKISSQCYGFINDNRLCVAFSRQKKLLIVVGDAKMFYKDKAERTAMQCVPALTMFYKKCLEKGGVINV